LSGVRPREPLLSLLSPAILGAAVLFLGVYMPLGLKDAIDKAVQTLGGG
jgi:hypothetical protein